VCKNEACFDTFSSSRKYHSNFYLSPTISLVILSFPNVSTFPSNTVQIFHFLKAFSPIMFLLLVFSFPISLYFISPCFTLLFPLSLSSLSFFLTSDQISLKTDARSVENCLYYPIHLYRSSTQYYCSTQFLRYLISCPTYWLLSRSVLVTSVMESSGDLAAAANSGP
jgi:hypothetical protein